LGFVEVVFAAVWLACGFVVVWVVVVAPAA
jgi:hypothetical protein